MTDVVQRSRTEFRSDPELLNLVLRPYRAKRCEYLKNAVVRVDAAHPDGPRLTASCDFEIPESCYIDDTGHFNSVEFNICYNQMAYYTIAKAVKEKLVAPFSSWSSEDYWTRQLADFLITDFRSAFHSAMGGRHFHGEFELLEVIEWAGSDIREPLVVLRTGCRYWDDRGGECHGEIRVAITNPPTVDR